MMQGSSVEPDSAADDRCSQCCDEMKFISVGALVTERALALKDVASKHGMADHSWKVSAMGSLSDDDGMSRGAHWGV